MVHVSSLQTVFGFWVGRGDEGNLVLIGPLADSNASLLAEMEGHMITVSKCNLISVQEGKFTYSSALEGPPNPPLQRNERKIYCDVFEK